MAKLYRDDTFYITELLARRFHADKDPTEALTNMLRALNPQEVQRLASLVYSRKFISNMIARDPDMLDQFKAFLADIAGPLRLMGVEAYDALPIDRRSALGYFLARIPPAQMHAALKRKIKFVRAVSEAEKRGKTIKSTVAQAMLSPPRPILDPIVRLREWLRIRRYMTLNFDYMLENKLILEDFRSTQPPPYGIEQAVEQGHLIKDGETGGLTRRFPDGQLATTDLYDDKAVGRLFEFALDSPDYRAQILHLHGRADRHVSMLLTDADSNRQYRRDRTVRTSLEQALDVTLTGNPIVFVGLGLSEAEITRALRELVSRGRATPHNPVFAIMALEKGGTKGWRDQMGFYSQYGIHLIHAGAPGRWRQGLPDLLTLIENLNKHLASESWGAFELPLWIDDAFPADRSRREGDGDDADVEVSGISGDRKIFVALAKEISRSLKKPKSHVIDSWTGYLKMFKAKLYTFATIEAMRDLYEDTIVYARRRQLPQSRKLFDDAINRQLGLFVGPLKPGAGDQGGVDNDPLFVREMLLWEQAAKKQGVTPTDPERGWRHQSVSCNWRLNTDGTVEPKGFDDEPPFPMPHAAEKLLSDSSYTTFFSPLGTGKGALLRALAGKLWALKHPYLMINCNFAIEFDSVLSQILMFVWQLRTDVENRPPPRVNRLLALEESLTSSRRKKRNPATPISAATIVISGLERLIDRRGASVAPELDLLLDKLISKEFAATSLRLIFLGGDGCERYIRNKLERAFPELEPNSKLKRRPKLLDEIKWSEITKGETVDLRDRGFLGYLLETAREEAKGRINTVELHDQLRYAAGRSTEALQPNTARSLAIESVMRVVLDNWHDLAFPPRTGSRATPGEAALDRMRAVLDLHFLEALSFIGLPIESSVLDHLSTPGGQIDKIFHHREKSGSKLNKQNVLREERCAALSRLAKFGLVLTIQPSPYSNVTPPANSATGSPSQRLPKNWRVPADELRVVLHRCVIAEMRERIGVRSGDELLSNSFSMTLAISMPTDITVASEAIQRELKTTVSRLRGSWRDTVPTGQFEKIHTELGKLREAVNPPKKSIDGHKSSTSKFDLSVIRSEALLAQLERAISMQATDMQVSIRAAAGVIRGFFSAASLVAQMPSKKELGDGEFGEFEEHRRRLDQLINSFRESQRARAAALDRLDKLRRGATSEVEDIIFRLVELIEKIPNDVHKNPALYSGELIWLLNERSVIAFLQGDLYEAQRGFRVTERANSVLRTPLPGQAWRRIEINRALVRIERGRIQEARSKLIEIERQMESALATSVEEDKRTKPLIESYLGLCDHLGGNYTMAERRFRKAISALIETEQQRALAVTYIRKAALLYGLQRTEEANKAAYLGRSTAEAGRQMDILWRARLTEIRGMDAKAESGKILTLFEQAKQYAAVMELPRVTIQVLRGMAEHHLALDDTETAGIAASEAMTVAVRYGMVLQRIALRVLMGRILLKRGDESGLYLLHRAIAHADRVGYQLQMDHAQEAIIEANGKR